MKIITKKKLKSLYAFDIDDSLDNILRFIGLRKHFPSINLLPKLVLN